MNQIQLEELANEFLIEGTQKKCIEKKRELYSSSWAVNRYLERVEFMSLCTKLLRTTGLSEQYIEFFQNKSYDIFLHSLKIVDSVEKALKDKNNNIFYI